MSSLAIIYVLYNSDIDLLNKSIKSLDDEVPEWLDVTFFLYNNSNHDVIDKLKIKHSFKYFFEGRNIGLAKAQNRIIKENLTSFDYFLTSDQDSIYSSNYLRSAIEYLESHDNCGCVVPIWRNTYLKKEKYESQIILSKGRLKKVDPAEILSDDFQVTHAICSGSIIRADLFIKVGLFNEDFFIDWIDNEWMWRGYTSGLSVYCYKRLRIDHQWGDKPLKIFEIEIPKKSDTRVYFTFRNGLALIFHRRLKPFFRRYVIIQLLKYLIYVFFSFRLKKYKKLLRAILDFRRIELANV
jgi:rhamnosyltransferase